MIFLSFQFLLINFIVAGIVTSSIYIFNKKFRRCNPIVLFIVSSLGTFIGTIIVMFIPDFEFIISTFLLKTVISILPGVILSFIFINVWIHGSETTGYI